MATEEELKSLEETNPNVIMNIKIPYNDMGDLVHCFNNGHIKGTEEKVAEFLIEYSHQQMEKKRTFERMNDKISKYW